jgi:2-polyprenyl-6-methoxyphenol hydroxylase-like FAD-dependent oxidoreductase
MPERSEKLHVVVVGAGMAGLGTALAVCNAGHEVTVLEQAPEFAEVHPQSLMMEATADIEHSFV